MGDINLVFTTLIATLLVTIFQVVGNVVFMCVRVIDLSTLTVFRLTNTVANMQKKFVTKLKKEVT